MGRDTPAAVLTDSSGNEAKYFALGSDYVPGAHVILYDSAGNEVKFYPHGGGYSSLSVVLHDINGNPVGVILDNSIYRVEARSTICGQLSTGGSEVKVTTIADVENSSEKRLQTESRIAPGSKVIVGNAVPSNPADLVVSFLTNGGSEDLLVNGSTTPVVFEYAPGAGVSVAIESLIFVFSADDILMDGSKFGPISVLTNGITIKTELATTTTLFTIKRNEDFLRLPGPSPMINNTGPKDFLNVSFAFGGLIKLHGDDSDKLTVTINDNLTDVRLKYLTATLYGVEE